MPKIDKWLRRSLDDSQQAEWCFHHPVKFFQIRWHDNPFRNIKISSLTKHIIPCCVCDHNNTECVLTLSTFSRRRKICREIIFSCSSSSHIQQQASSESLTEITSQELLKEVMSNYVAAVCIDVLVSSSFFVIIGARYRANGFTCSHIAWERKQKNSLTYSRCCRYIQLRRRRSYLSSSSLQAYQIQTIDHFISKLYNFVWCTKNKFSLHSTLALTNHLAIGSTIQIGTY